MARHSFIQMSKLSNVKGRISYITSHAKQENLYATYRTADNEFWSNLARESQQEFKRSGTEGKCIEARELIIALPEVYTRYEPQEVLEDFTEEFRKRYGVECVSALHHNKRKTNYHIHLTKGLFKGKERKALEVKIKETEVEIADRLDKIPDTLKADGYPDVQVFMRTFREMESVVEQYNRDLAEWEYQVSRKPTAATKEQHRPPERQSVLKHLREIQERNKQQPPQRQYKKSIDRDSR